MSVENTWKDGQVQDPVDVQVGKSILACRRRLNLSEHEFSTLLDVSQQKLLDWEMGRCSVTPSLMLRLCGITDEPVQSFFGTALKSNGKVRSSSVDLLAASDFNEQDEDVTELLQSYKRIADPGVRQRMRQLMRALVTPDAIN